MAWDKSGLRYNWVSNIIRDKDEPRKLKEKFISPQLIEKGSIYKNKLISWIDELEDDFANNTDNLEYINVIREMKQDISEVLEKYHSGNIGASYEKMKDIILSIMDESLGIAVSSVSNSIAFNSINDVIKGGVGTKQIEFFRARKSEKYKVFSREEMVHIPFDEREKVSSARFSIPGLPCLYLGTSTYCCWLELRTPPDHQFNVSPVRINLCNRIFNLTMTADQFEEISMIVEKENLNVKYVTESIKLWILSYAASYKVNDDFRAFKEEYIIPQLIMLVGRNLGLEGIAYYSKQVEDDRFAHMIAVNLALFAKYNGESRYSEICKDVELSPSYNYAMFKQLGYDEKRKISSTELNICNTKRPKLMGTFERCNGYCSTEFYDFDRYLFSHIAPEIKSIDWVKLNENGR